MAIRTRPIRDVLVKREIADDAAAFDVATTIGEVVEESQSELMTSGEGRALSAEVEVRQIMAEFDAKAAQRQAQLYRFILLVGAAITTVVSIVAAVT